jgi:hypothetical protein
MAATDNNASAHLLRNAVSKFGTAYAATKESLQSKAANILVIQGQLQMLCRSVSTGQPPQQQPQGPMNGRGRGQQRGGNNSGSNGGGSGSGGGYSNGGGVGGYTRWQLKQYKWQWRWQQRQLWQQRWERRKLDPYRSFASKAVIELELLLHPWWQR